MLVAVVVSCGLLQGTTASIQLVSYADMNCTIPSTVVPSSLISVIAPWDTTLCTSAPQYTESPLLPSLAPVLWVCSRCSPGPESPVLYWSQYTYSNATGGCPYVVGNPSNALLANETMQVSGLLYSRPPTCRSLGVRMYNNVSGQLQQFSVYGSLTCSNTSTPTSSAPSPFSLISLWDTALRGRIESRNRDDIGIGSTMAIVATSELHPRSRIP